MCELGLEDLENMRGSKPRHHSKTPYDETQHTAVRALCLDLSIALIK